jgi:di/tricarboxylate transporter
VEGSLSPGALSVGALALVIVASFTSRVNVGVLAVALAWPIALYAAGWPTKELVAAFPSSLFVTLLGVTLLFGAAQANGTMAAVTHAALRTARGSAALLPALIFGLSCAISTLGPGAIATSALMAPLAMAAAARAGVPAFLAALMVGNGANAGNLSPFSAVGVIVNKFMGEAGLGGHEWRVWAANFAAHALAAAAAWAMFGGPGLLRGGRVAIVDDGGRLEARHRLTLGVLGAWIVAVVFFGADLGFSAFAGAAVLVIARLADDSGMVRAVPWNVVVMVCGVSVLIGVLDRTGGMELFTTALANISTPATVNGVIAFVTGLISTYSSTSGVVYPAFLPAVPGLVQKLGGGDPLQIALSINVGAALVDVSPLSTIGALCIAALPAGSEDPVRLFRRLLAWGLAMTVVGALWCLAFIRFFAA